MIVALIGHTGAGKSSCLRALGIDLKLADMDSALGAFDPGWQRTLEWIRATDQTMVAVGVHWSLETLAQIKQRGDCPSSSSAFASSTCIIRGKGFTSGCPPRRASSAMN